MAHARCPIWWQQYINMFHMPLFFFFSGYCFKVAYLDAPQKYAMKRIKGIYVPYVKYCILFLLLHNLFFNLNIYNEYYGYQGSVSRVYNYGDVSLWVIKLLKITTAMIGEEQLLGGYWFLHTLFCSSFISFFIIYI